MKADVRGWRPIKEVRQNIYSVAFRCSLSYSPCWCSAAKTNSTPATLSSPTRKSSGEEHISASYDSNTQKEEVSHSICHRICSYTPTLSRKINGFCLRSQVFSTAVEVTLKLWVRRCPHMCLCAERKVGKLKLFT